MKKLVILLPILFLFGCSNTQVKTNAENIIQLQNQVKANTAGIEANTSSIEANTANDKVREGDTQEKLNRMFEKANYK